MKKRQIIGGVLWAAALAWLTGCGGRQVVLVTGFWPPTNRMLIPYSKNPALNPAGWQGADWRGTGYDVVAYFPAFPHGTDSDPAGIGDFTVDYQDVLRDFNRIVRTLRPEAILCYGQGAGPWEIEQNFPVHSRWRDDYRAPLQPDCFCAFGNRYAAGDVLYATLPAEAIQSAVMAQTPQLPVWVDTQGDAGDFICGYMGFVAADYQARHP
ncbi:MAG: hypothetical protein L0Y36_02715, partial [Planctomycetales bacterium]|nr:hypothetical protein [Planctomycetales bacterium]